MKKAFQTALIILGITGLIAGCGKQGEEGANVTNAKKTFEGATIIELSDETITVDGTTISENSESAVYAAKDIVFYLADQGFTYGEGTKEDEHTQEEADAHTVVHITEPGTYAVSGKLSKGQLAIDLGDDAKEDPEAVVTLILNGVDITCEVAPAVIFYNVYEACEADTETATKDVDTSKAGANVLIVDDTVNNVAGSYVARIYKSYELNEAGTEVIDNKKLHKYDAAFYSKRSMNIDGEEKGTGVLNIIAENEGLDSELHLTLNGGIVNILSGNDGINTNEDEVSVTTVNGGVLTIRVNGATGEGDGIDSNGWLVINGGTVITEACSFSMDAGIDSDMGIHINGGAVAASGNMLDIISESTQNYAVFNFASRQKGGSTYALKDAEGKVVAEATPNNDFTYIIFSSERMKEGTYTLWKDKTQLAAAKGDMGSGFPGGFPGGEMPEMDFENIEGFDPSKGFPEGMEMPGWMPEGMQPPSGGQMPGGMPRPDGERGPGGKGPNGEMAEVSTSFEISEGGNYFNGVTEAK